MLVGCSEVELPQIVQFGGDDRTLVGVGGLGSRLIWRVELVEFAKLEVVEIWKLQVGVKVVVDQRQFCDLMSIGLAGSASNSPKCVSENKVWPGVSDRLKADARQKSGTSNGPWSPSMP